MPTTSPLRFASLDDARAYVRQSPVVEWYWGDAFPLLVVDTWLPEWLHTTEWCCFPAALAAFIPLVLRQDTADYALPHCPHSTARGAQ